jgi:hypothetical protein
LLVDVRKSPIEIVRNVVPIVAIEQRHGYVLD